MVDDRRILIMPILLPGTYPAYTGNIQKWGMFFLRNKSVVIQGNCQADPLCGALQVEVIKTVGATTPVVPTAPSSSLTLPVLFR
jgi:hypothetical protein